MKVGTKEKNAQQNQGVADAQFRPSSPSLAPDLTARDPHADAFGRVEAPRLLPERSPLSSLPDGRSQSSSSALARDLPRPALSEALAIIPARSPLEALLIENESLGRKAHIDPETAGQLAGIAKETSRLIQRESERLHELESTSAEIQGAIRRLHSELRELDADMERRAAGLPAAQSNYGQSLRDLAQLYAVRGWSDEQKNKEIAYLQPRLARLSEKLQVARENRDDAEIVRIEKKKASLEGLLFSALAGPSADHKFNETLMPLFAIVSNPEENELQRSVAWTEITLRMLAQTPTNIEDAADDDNENKPLSTDDIGMSFISVDDQDLSVRQAQFYLAQNAREMFGAMSEKALDFAQAIEGALRYNPRLKTAENPALLGKLAARRVLLGQFLESTAALPLAEREKLAVETQIYKREAEVIDRSLKALSTVSELAAGVDQQAYERRDMLQSHIGRAEQDFERVQNEILAQQKTLRLREYQSLSTALTTVTQKIRENGRLLSQASLQGLARQKELKTTLFNLDAAFAAIMHRLETLDSQNWIDACEDPYPSNWGIRERLWVTGEERPSPSELMRQYHLAKIGADSVSDAYMQTLSKLAWNGMSANNLMKNLEPYVLDPTTREKRSIRDVGDIEHVYLPVIGSIKDFAMRHPVLARDLAANLMHTFSILSTDASWLSSAKAVLQRKTYEDWVSDATLGGKEHLYTTEVGHTLSPEVIAFLDLAEKAPYIANGIKGAAGGSAAGNLAQRIASWIPGGSHPFFQGIAGALGGVSEVKAHKLAAAKITRNQEVAANMIWAAIRATNEGKGLKGALSDALGYGLARQALQLAGSTFRAVHEEGATGLAARSWDRYRSRWQSSPGQEAAKTIGVSAVGVVATGAAVVGSGLLGTFAFAGALPAVIIVGGGAALGFGGLSAFRLVRDNFFVSDEQRKRESLERLKGWTAKLPKAIQPKLREGVAPPEAQNTAVSAIAQAVEYLPDEVYEEALAQKGGERRGDGSILTDQEAQEKYILTKLDEQVLSLDRMRQKQLALKASSIADETGAEVEEDELVRRFRALKESVHPHGAIANDARREHVQQVRIKTALSEMQAALPVAELERDPVEDELYRRLEALKRRDVSPRDIEALSAEVETMRIRQIEESALHEEGLRGLWDPGAEFEQELEARLVGLQLPNVPSRSAVDAARSNVDEDLQGRLDALRASSSTKHRRQAVALEEKR